MTGMTTAQTSGNFPSDADLKALRLRFRQGGSKGLDDVEIWNWHAYVYGLRRVALGIFDEVSPLDPDGEWYARDLAEAAERFYRASMGRPGRKYYPPATSQDAVRTDWPNIPMHELTRAEYAVAEPQMSALFTKVKAIIAAAETPWRQTRKHRVPQYKPAEEMAEGAA